MTEDDQLMVRVQEGDATAFNELVDALPGTAARAFFSAIRAIGKSAEDLTQETLLRVYNQSWDYLPTGRFRGWIYRIAHNLLIDNIRRQSHDALVHAYTGTQDGGVRSRQPHRRAARCRPKKLPTNGNWRGSSTSLLKELPDEQRLTFTMHYFSGLPLSEVAAAMETSLPTCKSRLRLAREKLRQKLRERGLTGAGIDRLPGGRVGRFRRGRSGRLTARPTGRAAPSELSGSIGRGYLAFVAVTTRSSGSVVRIRPRNWTSWATLFWCSCSPIGPA